MSKKMTTTTKIELTDETMVNDSDVALFRVRAIEDIPIHGVKKGDLGGWVESLLLPNGDYRIADDAWVADDAQISGRARVDGTARVLGNAVISSSSDYFVMDNVGSESSALTLARTVNGHSLSVGCWTNGTLDTLMSEVEERSKYWDATEERKAYWFEQYRTAHAQCAEIVDSWNNE